MGWDRQGWLQMGLQRAAGVYSSAGSRLPGLARLMSAACACCPCALQV